MQINYLITILWASLTVKKMYFTSFQLQICKTSIANSLLYWWRGSVYVQVSFLNASILMDVDVASTYISERVHQLVPNIHFCCLAETVHQFVLVIHFSQVAIVTGVKIRVERWGFLIRFPFRPIEVFPTFAKTSSSLRQNIFDKLYFNTETNFYHVV